MASDGEALILPAPTQTEENVKEDESKVCDTCRVPLKSHPGTPGGIKCLGRVFSNGLQAVLDELSTVRRELEKERQEALDREARLSRSIKALQKEVTTKHEEYLEALKRIEFLEKERKARRRGEQDPPTKSKTKPNPKPGKEPAQSWADRTSAQNVPSPSSESGAETDGRYERTEFEDDANERHDTDIERQPSSSKALQARRRPTSRTLSTPSQSTETETKTKKPTFAPPQSDDDSWQLVLKKPPQSKKAVLYVGNLSSTTTAEGLRTYIERRAEAVEAHTPRVYEAKVFVPVPGNSAGRDHETAGARLTIAVTDLPTLDNRSFWPRPAYVRRWKFQPKQGANLDPENMERAEPPKDTDSESGKPEESAGTPGVTTNL